MFGSLICCFLNTTMKLSVNIPEFSCSLSNLQSIDLYNLLLETSKKNCSQNLIESILCESCLIEPIFFQFALTSPACVHAAHLKQQCIKYMHIPSRAI